MKGEKNIVAVAGFAIREVSPARNFNWLSVGAGPEDQNWCSSARKGQGHELSERQRLLFYRGLMCGVFGEVIYKATVR